MRRLRPILALAIAAVLVGVGAFYWFGRQRQEASAAPPPQPLPTTLNASASGWRWSYTQAGKAIVEVHAKDFKQLKEPPVFDLTGVELKIFHEGSSIFDRVTSTKAQFSPGDGKMFSEGEVQIALALPAEGNAGRVLAITSSGVTFENKTGKAETDRHARFSLDVGEGEADGAVYDPQTKELRLKSNATLLWRGKEPGRSPMRIEAPEVLYKELEGKIYLNPSAKFIRNGLTMTGGPTVVTVEKGNIRLVESSAATGTDKSERRQMSFGAESLQMIFQDRGRMEKITGQTNARLESVSPTARTVVRTQRLDLSFETSDKKEATESTLSQALASGASIVESFPIGRPGQPAADTRVLRSEVIDLAMKSGGEEIDRIKTHSPGTVDFIPNRPASRKRRLEGERLEILYGASNQIKSFRAVNVATRTEPPVQSVRKSAAPQLTWSDDLEAFFDPESGEMTRLEQWNNFRFREGERQAKADRAALDQKTDQVTLTGHSRAWDAGGSTEGDTIVMDNRQDRTTATGHVKSVREPQSTSLKTTAPGKSGNVVQATADRMTTTANNSKIVYEGHAFLSEGENRLRADKIEIDRVSQLLKGQGNVVNHLKDQKQGLTTMVTAASMSYSDKDRVAFYEGGVVLDRPGLNVKSRRLRAYLTEPQEETSATVPDSGLEKAYAEGAVEVLQSDALRTRFGVGETAEYLVTDGMVVLEGGSPKLTETAKGAKPSVTQGRKLTWFSNTDKLLVDGADQQRAVSNLRRKK